uniref:Uncharacterized protein n=1 Tax=viral metagenome TaxID=1070528 RepID=A0A6M3LVN9_9ZZZZ
MTTRKKLIKILKDCGVRVPPTRGHGDIYAILVDNLEEFVEKEKLKVLNFILEDMAVEDGKVVRPYPWFVKTKKYYKEKLGL